MSRTAKKVFETPMRPISSEQFNSLREKIVKESPGLYKTRILSDPTVDKFVSKSVRATPVSVFNREEATKTVGVPLVMPAMVGEGLDSELLPEQDVATQTKMPAAAGMTAVGEVDGSSVSSTVSGGGLAGNFTGGAVAGLKPLGSYENPALEIFTRRVVNKELEIKRIVTNIATLFVWNLFRKFLEFFLYNTIRGRYLCKKVAHFFLAYVVFKINPHANLDSRWVTICKLQNLSHFVHILLILNVVTSLYILLIKSQNIPINDLGLNERQKELLGVTDSSLKHENVLLNTVLSSNSSRPLSSSSKDKSFGDRAELYRDSEAEKENSLPISQPFLFKSLQTPLKASRAASEQRQQQQQQQQQQSIPRTRFDSFNKQHAYPDLRKAMLVNRAASTPTPTSKRTAPLPTPIDRPGSGYMPSNKYAYMVD